MSRIELLVGIALLGSGGTLALYRFAFARGYQRGMVLSWRKATRWERLRDLAGEAQPELGKKYETLLAMTDAAAETVFYREPMPKASDAIVMSDVDPETEIRRQGRFGTGVRYL
jgi:hypothetical protein